MTRLPMVLCLDRDPREADARRIRPGAPIACVGGGTAGASGILVGVVGEPDVEAVVDAVARGWDAVIRLDLRGELRRLVLEDLGRIGQVVDEGALEHVPLLDPMDDELLGQLASGVTIRQAARAVGTSDRTAARRLARLRQAMGVSTTAGLVARWRGAPHRSP
jgi:hypothetical protein